MKKYILAVVTVLMGAQAFAADNVAAIRLTNAINARLVKVNAQRSEEGKTLYCASLSAKQVALIEKKTTSLVDNKTVAKDLRRVAVTDFTQDLADTLVCYPLACPTQGRSSLGGAVCNAKAYNMDLQLIQEAFDDIAGRDVQGYESTANFLTR